MGSEETCLWVLCFSPLSSAAGSIKIFGFAEFLTALALLVVIYTTADVRYKFRIAITPGSLRLATFLVIALIGGEALLSEIWIAEGFWVPRTFFITRAIWQGIFGLLFLATFMTWMYYAFILPPIFGRRNARTFARELYSCILRGEEAELAVVANELARSAAALIRYSRGARTMPRRNVTVRRNWWGWWRRGGVEDYAHDILLLIANRKFCQQIVKASPVTAQVFFDSMISLRRFDLPIGQFARNITSEAIAQDGSFLYEEAEGYTSGLLGYLKPVSQAVFGNWELVEGLSRVGISPLDIYYTEPYTWDASE